MRGDRVEVARKENGSGRWSLAFAGGGVLICHGRYLCTISVLICRNICRMVKQANNTIFKCLYDYW